MSASTLEGKGFLAKLLDGPDIENRVHVDGDGVEALLEQFFGCCAVICVDQGEFMGCVAGLQDTADGLLYFRCIELARHAQGGR